MRRTVQPAQPAQPRANAVSIIAWVQFTSAAITALIVAYPSIVFFVSLQSTLIGLMLWLPGLYLLRGYWLFATQRRAAASSMALWVLSFIFNFPGLIIALRFSLSNYASSRNGFEFIPLIPPLIGTVLGVLGMIATHLESKR